MMNRVLITVFAAFWMTSAPALAGDAFSGVYEDDEKHRYITFTYSHFGFSNPYLRWRDWDATLNWDEDAPENSTINVVIDAASIDSGVDVFDGHLKGENFFDVSNHPEITFVSTGVEKTGENSGTVTGDLTIKGITKPVTLDVQLNNASFDERRNQYKIGFSATAQVKRSDFDVDAYAPGVSDEVDIIIEAEFIKPGE